MKTHPFNPASFLETEEEIAQYLNEAYADDNPEVFIIALGNVVKARGVAEISRKAGLNRENLYRIFSGRTQPRWGTIHALIHALGLRLNATP